MEIPIIYEDTDVCVVSKPSGLIVHPDGRTEEPTLADWVLARYSETGAVGEPWVSPQGETVLRPGIVHRLDRTTSGVMIIAKTPSAYEHLKKQFQAKTVRKEYRAFVYGQPKEDSGIIEAEIVRIRSAPPRWGVQRSGEEKKHRAAITEWHVLARKECQEPRLLTSTSVAYLALFPKTGRTHQLRVHLKHLGHPIICDPLYATGKPCLLGFTRTALHAFRLTLVLPSGEARTFEASLPEDFQHAEMGFENID